MSYPSPSHPNEGAIDLDALIQAAGDAIMAVDGKGVIRFWNPAAERMFGYSAHEAVGRSLDLIIPARYRQRHWIGFRNTISSGVTRHGGTVLRVPALHRDGRTLSIAMTVALLSSKAGAVEMVAAIVRDETERYQEERELRKRIADLEGR